MLLILRLWLLVVCYLFYNISYSYQSLCLKSKICSVIHILIRYDLINKICNTKKEIAILYLFMVRLLQIKIYAIKNTESLIVYID